MRHQPKPFTEFSATASVRSAICQNSPMARAHAGQKRHNAPGLDGTSYASWAAAGPRAMRALYRLIIRIAAENPPLKRLNDSRLVCLPEAISHEEGLRVLRHAGQTRPLGLKNIDAKVVAATVAHPLGRSMAASIGLHQRGFLAGGRRSLEHILEIDARARELTLRSQSEDDTHVDDLVLLAVDASAACPSLARPAIHAAVRHSTMPTGAQHLVRATMLHRTARLTATASASLAASLYVLTTEPIARVMRSTVDAVDSAFIYADDQALLLYSVTGIPQLNGVVNISRKALTLHINFKRSKIAPLAYDMHDAEAQRSRLCDRLASLGEPWTKLTVATHTTYLGCDVGSTAGVAAWNTPLQKWQRRSLLLAETTVSPSVTTRLHTSRAVSVLDYVSAMTQPPADIKRREQQVIAKLLRASKCSYSRGLVHRWRQWGVPNIRMLNLRRQANRVPTALRLAPLWRPITDRL